MNLLQKLRQLHTDITASNDRLKIVDGWALAERLIGRFPLDAAETKRVFAEKDAAGLDALIASLENPAPKKALDANATDDEKRAAMKAFRKRLKLARLEDESKLGGRYVSDGKSSSIDAIKPPEQFEARVWRALVKAGELVDAGQGFYGLAGEPEFKDPDA